MDSLWEQMHGYSFDALKLAVTEIASNGYPMNALISQLHDEVITKTDLEDIDKALICEKIAAVGFTFLETIYVQHFYFSVRMNFKI